MSAVATSQSQAAVAVLAQAEEAPSLDPATILGRILSELESAGHKMLASVLEGGSIALENNEVVITVEQPASVVNLMMGPEPKQIANAAATSAAGRVLKVNVKSGVVQAGNGTAPPPRVVRNGSSARSRAVEDPVVQRMQEKFGAEIRTVIDHRQKD